jgi:hypothetical protein
VYAPAFIERPDVATALVYSDQLPTLEPGERAWFSPTQDPRDQRAVQLAATPVTPWDRSTSLIHFALLADHAHDPSTRRRPGGPPSEISPRALPAGTVGWVKFAPRPRQMRVIPAGSVLEAPEGPYVLVVSRESGTLGKRSIEIGRTFTGLAAVLSGLELREQVVSVNAFFWDAERRLRIAQPNGGGSPRR